MPISAIIFSILSVMAFLFPYSKAVAAPCCFCQPWDTLYVPDKTPEYRHDVVSPACSVSNPCCETGSECNPSCTPIIYKPCYVPKRQKVHRAKVRKRVRRVAGITIIEEIPSCNEPRLKITLCPKLLEPLIKCKVIFPGDLVEVEDACKIFKRKLKTCEPSTCTTPYVQDPTLTTRWEIHGKKGNRCIVSNTNQDMGLRDEHDVPIIVTQKCEYDIVGINALIKRFNDMEKHYYHFTTCERGVGIYNCTFKSGAINVRNVRRNWE